MKNSEDDVLALKEIGLAIVQGKSTAEMLARLIGVMMCHFGLLRGGFIMQYNAFWSAERMLGFDFKDLSGVLGMWKTTRVFEGELGELIYAEVLTEEEMNGRFMDFGMFCETKDGLSRIRIPLKYRQKFIGFFEFERWAKLEDGADSVKIAALMEMVGNIVADVAETRTKQRIEFGRLLEENRNLQSKIVNSPVGLVGESAIMRDVYLQVNEVAPSDATVLVRGPSGTGKELIARAIVEHSERKGKPFLVVNCAALPESLIESELFGHEVGAFTGATTLRKGRAEEADGGTLFLDEIGDLTPQTQVKLLRFLQERTFSRVGSNVELHSNVRFIAATSRNLEDLMEKKLFREDLYYRLNVFSIQVPPLVERKGDIILLARHFVEKFNKKYGKCVATISPEVAGILIDHSWPGNVRELENCIERAVLTSTSDLLRVQNLPPNLRPRVVEQLPCDGGTLEERVRGFEKEVIEEAIQRNGGNLSAAGRELGLSPRMMYYKVSKYK